MIKAESAASGAKLTDPPAVEARPATVRTIVVGLPVGCGLFNLCVTLSLANHSTADVSMKLLHRSADVFVVKIKRRVCRRYETLAAHARGGGRRRRSWTMPWPRLPPCFSSPDCKQPMLQEQARHSGREVGRGKVAVLPTSSCQRRQHLRQGSVPHTEVLTGLSMPWLCHIGGGA